MKWIIVARVIVAVVLAAALLALRSFPVPKGRIKMVGMPAKAVSTCLALAERLGVALPVVQACFVAGSAEVS